MSSSSTQGLVRYVVYMPYSERASPTPIFVSKDAYVNDLADEIVDHRNFKRHLENEELILLKCSAVPIQPPTIPDTPIQPPTQMRFRLVSEWACDNVESTMMESTFRLKEYFPRGPAPEESKMIDIVAVTDTIIRDLRAFLSSDRVLLHHPPEPNSRHDAVTFKICCEGSDSANPKLLWYTAISSNEYSPERNLVEFVADAVEKPRRAASGDAECAKFLLRCFQSMLADDADQAQIAGRLLTDDESDASYARWNHEMIHYVQAVACMKKYLERLVRAQEGSLTFDQARHVVLERFEDYWLTEVEDARCTIGAQFPFPLVAETRDQTRSNALEIRTYRPKPDVAFLKHDFPRFLVEFDLSDNERDKCRLLVQMACALRLALTLQCDEPSDRKFFLMGAFFTKQWEVRRYFVYAIEQKICYQETTFHMRNFSELTAFLFEFYNYARHVRDEDTLDDKKQDIRGLVQSINAKEYKSLHTNVTKKSKKRPRSGGGQNGANGSPNQSTSKHIRTVMEDALREAGIEVISGYPEELEPLVKLPDHVVEGTTRDGERVVVKRPREKSEELSLLRELLSQKSPHNHVIPLLGTVESSLGPLIILPRAISLSFPSLFRDVIAQLSRELVEGVAFLHRQKIAHLDIKLDNLVYSFETKRLYIIDFDIAMQCKDADEMVEISCGTPEWSAPEIVHGGNKPLSAFSPIRADLWSCGKVLWTFDKVAIEKDEDISMLMNLLMDREPRRRPLLYEVVDEGPDFWTSRRLHQALMGYTSDQNRQEMMEVVVKPKRARDDADGEGLPLKVSRQISDSAASLSLVSLLSSSTQRTLISSPGSSSDSSSPFSLSNLFNKAHRLSHVYSK